MTLWGVVRFVGRVVVCLPFALLISIVDVDAAELERPEDCAHDVDSRYACGIDCDQFVTVLNTEVHGGIREQREWDGIWITRDAQVVIVVEVTHFVFENPTDGVLTGYGACLVDLIRFAKYDYHTQDVTVIVMNGSDSDVPGPRVIDEDMAIYLSDTETPSEYVQNPFSEEYNGEYLEEPDYD